jgi:ATP-binding cassette, subfamily C, bacterial
MNTSQTIPDIENTKEVSSEPLFSVIRSYFKDMAQVLSWRAVGIIAFMLLISATEGISLILLAPLLQLTGLDLGSSPADQAASVVRGIFNALGLPLTLTSVLGVYVIIVAAKALLDRSNAVINFRLQQRFVAQLRERLYKTLIRADWRFFVRRRNSDFMHKLTDELENIGSTTFELMNWIVNCILTLTYFVFALFLSPVMTLLVLVAGGVLSALLRHRTYRARGHGKRLSQAYENLYAAISEHFSGMKTAKSHGVEDKHADLFLDTAREVERGQVTVTSNQQAVRFWFQIGAAVILAVTIYIAVSILRLEAANILLLLYLFSRLIPMLGGLQSGFQSFLNYIPAYTNIKDLERECVAAAESLSETSREAPQLQRDLVFDNVSYSYQPDLPQVLKGLHLTIQAGKTTAIVGPSGAGKSTVADIAVSLLSPTQGQLLIDGLPLERDQLRSWRHNIGYVAQDTFIFHDTVRANLLLTKPNASEGEITEALRAAAADFVFRLPKGLDTVLGDRGVRLSGGERQRLALARALLRHPSLLILDEATSALDVENEQRIQGAIEALRGKMTILVIAHRLSTIRNADVIYVLEHGQTIEKGTWQTLVSRLNGRFRGLCEAQGLVGESAVATA